MSKKYFLILFIPVIILGNNVAYSENEITINFEGRQQRVTYDLYVPPKIGEERRLPVLVCVGGIPMQGDQYIQSDTHECYDEAWFKFAYENQLAILGLGFLFIPEDWPKKASYQFPKAWSGKALFKVLNSLSKQFNINPKELYLFGISAGAQYSVRMALAYPEKVKAVAAHAAGGFDWPKVYTSTKFLLTVGELDDEEITRLQMARLFTKIGRKKGIDVQLKVISKLGHRQTEKQNEMSREFFKKVMGTQP